MDPTNPMDYARVLSHASTVAYNNGHRASTLPGWAQKELTASVGFWDAQTGGLGPVARDLAGYGDVIDMNSGDYQWGHGWGIASQVGTALAGSAPVSIGTRGAPLAGGRNALGDYPVINEQVGGAIAQINKAACGAACGQMLTGIPQQTLIAKAGARTHVSALAKAMGSAWRAAFIDQSNLMAHAARGPFIAQIRQFGWRMDHFVVVDAVQGGRVFIRDPWGGGSTYQMTATAFDGIWTGLSVHR